MSEEVKLNYKTLRYHSLTGTNVTMKKANRLEQGSNIRAEAELREVGAEGRAGLGRFDQPAAR